MSDEPENGVSMIMSAFFTEGMTWWRFNSQGVSMVKKMLQVDRNPFIESQGSRKQHEPDPVHFSTTYNGLTPIERFAGNPYTMIKVQADKPTVIAALAVALPSALACVAGGNIPAATETINNDAPIEILNFYAEDYGKVYRSGGTCEMCRRDVYVEGVSAYGGGEVVGINIQTGDTAKLVNVCTDANTPCQLGPVNGRRSRCGAGTTAKWGRAGAGRESVQNNPDREVG
ncbi:hypothetical protein SODALDRAFT_354071 [Sodiomyces alkalinus F11]|uniref:Pectate lyase n=1 Tax=Sodiomyces alkalinus (strain CBS 110278 / VKM F-3762 / F11) TaxID=1314773 RepID=A0A3N2Q5H3_SODAK|nr:hypothetical protein SODALDRAFT_354071 [Sodiomyces alkalinus F11]ROT41947.1 hypothetical protein SODALDRAFT_354071 [Sodiomyces alkalinus F11]